MIVAAQQDHRPLVSCVCPTFNRREFIGRAIGCFLSQTCGSGALELIVLDDGDDAVRDLVPNDERIHYFYQPPRMTYGAKLNACIKLALGDFICHVDDDDWFATNRVERQVLPLIENPDLVVSGTSQLYYYRHGTQDAVQFTGSKESWLGGICYRKSAWQERPFDEEQDPGADCRWLRGVPNDRRLDLADPALIVATVHGSNHSPKRTVGTQWKRVGWPVVAKAMGKGLSEFP